MDTVVGGGAIASACIAIFAIATKTTRFRVRVVSMLALGFLVNFFARGNIPGLFETLEQQLDLSISQLGALPMASELAGALTLPLWGLLSDKYLSRLPLIFAASFVLGGIATGTSGLAVSFATMLISRAATGVFIISLYTLASTFLVHLFEPDKRGRLFGALALFTAVGSFAGTICGSLVGDQPMLWRYLFFTVGAVFSVYAGAALFSMRDFTPRVYESADSHIKFWGSIIRKPTFVVLSTTSALNNLPFLALSFLLLWFRYVGFSEAESNEIFAFAAVGVCAGGVAGGIVSDRVFRLTGKPVSRVAVSQASIVVTLGFAMLLMFGVEREGDSFWAFCASIFFLAFFVIWAYPSCDLVLIADIVPRDKMSSGIALQQFLQGIGASFGSLLVGFVAQSAFGYVARTEPIEQMPAALREANLAALTHALATILAGTWGLQLALYTIVYFTYAKDRAVSEEEKRNSPPEEPVAGFLAVPSTSSSMEEEQL